MVKRVSLGILLPGVLIVGAGQAAADPPTPVNCPYTITSPGQYFLAADCTGTGGITITASDVHLKLMGHTMTGPDFAGIQATSVSHVHIEGPGTITGYFHGIFFNGVSDSHVEQVSAINNRDGLSLARSTDTHVNNNIFSRNALAGVILEVSSDNHLNNNQAIGNGFFGIFVESLSTGNHINGNTALGNMTLYDLADDNTNCDNNTWNGNTFVSRNQTCIQ